jgi:hypothetical protein
MLCGMLVLLCPLVVSAESLSLSTNLTGAPGDVVTSYLTISNVGGLAVESLDIRVSYDPAEVDFITGRNGVGLQGGPYAPTSPLNNDTGGLVIISGISLIVGVTPAEGAVLFELDFQIRNDAVAGITVQELVEVAINEDLISSSIGATPNATGGSIDVVLADGDINVDGVVNVVDVLLATRFALGLDTPDAPQLAHGNVAPLVGGVPTPADSQIGVDDLLLIQKKALTGAF